MELTARRGVIHTLESLLAAILFLFLVVSISQRVAPQQDVGPDIALRTRNVVETLDTGGQLRQPVTNQSLGILENRVENRLPGLNVGVAATILNATAGTATFTDETSATFTVNASAVRSETLRLWFDDAVAPNVTVNGDAVTNNTGTVDGYETVGIADETVDGVNELNISVAGTSTVGYSIDIQERYDTGSPPTGTDVISVTYTIGGRNQSFQPAEVSVQAWQ